MTPRLNPFTTSQPLTKALVDFGNKVQSGFDPALLRLVKIRASQINGCALSLYNHTRDARANGETEERLFLLDGWRGSPHYSERERAALAWTEALTLLPRTWASDDDYALLAGQFTAEEQVRLTLMIVVINGFNRLCVGFRLGPQPT